MLTVSHYHSVTESVIILISVAYCEILLNHRCFIKVLLNVVLGCKVNDLIPAFFLRFHERFVRVVCQVKTIRN